MEGLKIDIDKTAVEKAVIQAVINSAIGTQMEKAIADVLAAKTGNFGMDRWLQNAITTEIQRSISIIIRQRIEEEKEQIRAIVNRGLSDDVVLEITSAALEFITEKIIKGRA